jgi:hypothetical protein
MFLKVLHLLKKHLKSRKLLSRRTGEDVTSTKEEAKEVLLNLRNEIAAADDVEGHFRIISKVL